MPRGRAAKRPSDIESDEEFDRVRKVNRKKKNTFRPESSESSLENKGYLVKLKKYFSKDFKTGKCLMVKANQIIDDNPDDICEKDIIKFNFVFNNKTVTLEGTICSDLIDIPESSQ
ncbi:unnamed protein product, partial [Brachionus calyciflorus]